MAEEVIQTILTGPTNLRPRSYGTFEPLNLLPVGQELEIIADTWLGGGFLPEGEKPTQGLLQMNGKAPARAKYMVSWDYRSPEVFRFISVSVSSGYLAKGVALAEFVALAFRIFGLVEGAWGEIVFQKPVFSALGFDLRKRMPPPQWMLLLGKPYIELFGEDRIRTTPCHAVHQLASGDYGIQTTPHPSIIPDDETVFRVSEHLGLEAFMAQGKSSRSYKDGLAPKFNWSST